METILQTMWKISWQTAVLAGVVFIVTRLARKAPASWRYGLWLIVLVKFLVPPFAEVPGDWVKWQRSEPSQAKVMNAAPQKSVPSAVTANPPVSAEVAPSAPALVVHSQPDAEPARSLNLLPSLWIAGASAMLGLLIVRMVKQAMVVRSSIFAPGEIIDLLTECAGQMGLPRTPRVMFSDAAQTPMLVGLLHPTILLPPAILDSCGTQDLRAILLHELAHVKRLDMAVLWLEQLVKVVYFFNPALWIASREIRRERELACDEMVLSRSSIARESYASGYVAALKMASRISVFATSLAMAEPFVVEKRRLQMIMRSRITRFSFTWVVALAVVAVLGLPTFSVTSGPPTAADLANALKQQETACGASLEVTFNTGSGPGGSRNVESRQYIRTPDKLFERSHRPGGSIVTYTYDRNTGEARRLIAEEPGSEVAEAYGEYNCMIGKFHDTSFSHEDLIETARFTLFDGALCDIISRGTVSTTMEDIDGSKCYRVDIPTTLNTDLKYVAWVDPNIGYCPRLINITKTGSPEVISFKDYREVAKGVWFPMKMTIVTTHEGGKQKNLVDTVVDVRVGRVIPKDELEIKFPAGTEVHVREGLKFRTYTEPEKGSASRSSDLLAGLKAVEGPGLVITLTDSPRISKTETRKDVIQDYLVHDYDIREVVNELSAAGAEAISVNDQRVVATTAIRSAGSTITVNSTPISHPYVIRAIGNPGALAEALSAKNGSAQMLFLLDMIKVVKSQNIILPAYKGKTSFEYAKPVD